MKWTKRIISFFIGLLFGTIVMVFLKNGFGTVAIIITLIYGILIGFLIGKNINTE